MSVDPALYVYVVDFIAESRIAGRPVQIDNLSVRFTNALPDNILGNCTPYNRGVDGRPAVLINTAYWEYESDTFKKVVVFHELGHCVLWRPHVLTYLGPNNNITSIMYPSINTDISVYADNWAYYMHELFYGF